MLRRAAAEAEDTLDSVSGTSFAMRMGGPSAPSAASTRSPRRRSSGQAVVFKTKANSGVIVTKTFRLFPNTDGLEVDLKFESPDKERSVVYNLLGPYGIPIEGEWYTGTFRDVVLGTLERARRSRSTPTRPATSPRRPSSQSTTPRSRSPLPGVENQYFAILGRA